MTWKDLADKINNEFTPEQQKQDVTAYLPDMDEFFECSSVLQANEKDNNVLDNGHKYLYVAQ